MNDAKNRNFDSKVRQKAPIMHSFYFMHHLYELHKNPMN